MKSNTALLEVPMVSKLLTVLAIFCSVQVLAGPKSLKRMSLGTKDGGGGTVVYPTNAEVRAAIDKTYVQPRQEAGTLKIAIFSLRNKASSAKDPVIKKVLADFFKKSAASNYHTAIDEVENTIEYDIVDGPCYDRFNQPRAAAVKSAYLGRNFPKSIDDLENRDDSIYAKLCYSVSELAKVPRANLEQHLIALSLHEISHLFGYDEAVAVKLQNFLLESGKGLLRDGFDDSDYVQALSVEMMTKVKELNQEVKDKSRDTKICARIGSLVEMSARFMTNADNAGVGEARDPSRPTNIDGNALNFASEMNLEIYVLNGYCGVRDIESMGDVKLSSEYSYDTLYTPEGDRAQLVQQLKKVAGKIQKIQKLLKVDASKWTIDAESRKAGFQL